MSVPAGYIKLGVVGYSPMGAYDPSVTYNKYNVVFYQGSSYFARQDGITAVAPGSDSGVYWGILAEGTSYTVKDFTVNDLTADTTLPGYAYSQDFVWNGMNASTMLDTFIVNNDYDGLLAVSGGNNEITVYFDSMPSTDIDLRIRAFYA